MRKLIKILVCFLVVFGTQSVYGFEKVEEHKYEYELNGLSPMKKTYNYKFRISDKEMMKNIFFVKRKLDGDDHIQILKEEFTKTYYHLKIKVIRFPHQAATTSKFKITLVKSDEVHDIPVLEKPSRDKIELNMYYKDSLTPKLSWNGEKGELVMFKLFTFDYVHDGEQIWECAVTRFSDAEIPPHIINNDTEYELRVFISNEAGKFSEPRIIYFHVKSELTVSDFDPDNISDY